MSIRELQLKKLVEVKKVERESFLEFLRASMGWSAPELYYKLGWSRQRYHQAVQKGINISLSPLMLEALAEKLQVPLEDIKKIAVKWISS